MKRSAVAAGAVAAGAALALAGAGAYGQGKKWYPFSVEEHNPPFDMASPVKEVMYSPLEKAEKKWKICVSFPHMKDAYWLAVDYGVVGGGQASGRQDAARRGRRLHQAREADIADRGLRRRPAPRRSIIGAISFDGLNNLVAEASAKKNIPVIDVINGMSSQGAVGEVARVVRRDGRQGRRVHRQAASEGFGRGQGRLVPGPARRRLGRGRQHRLPRRDQGQRASRSSRPNTATPARKCSPSWSRTCCRPTRTSTTSSAPR